MRKIKFRGWAIKDSEWRIGNYATDGKVHEITTLIPYAEGEALYASQIDLESLGQYTGLKDKNGKEIYEGDIIRSDKEVYSITYFDGFPEYLTSKDLCETTLDYISKLDLDDFEVIGNIYENPELLKAE